MVDEARRWWGHPTNWTRLVQSDLPISEDFIRSYEIYVAEESIGPVGFYVVRGNKLEELWITPSHFGTGVGKELFLHAKDKKWKV